MIPRQATGEQAADGDSPGDEEEESRAVIGKCHHFPAKLVEYRDGQGSDEVKPAGGEYRSEQRSVAKQVLDLADPCGRIPVQVSFWIRCRGAPGDPACHQPADQCHADEEVATPPVWISTAEIPIWMQEGEHRACHDDSQDRRDVGGHVDDAIGPGQIPLGDQLREDSVLRWPEEGTLGSHQEQYAQHGKDRQIGVDSLQRERRHAEQHGEHLHPLGDDDDLAFGESVGDGAAEDGKDDKGSRKHCHHHRLGVDGDPVEGDSTGDEQDELSEHIVVEGSQQLRRSQGEE